MNVENLQKLYRVGQRILSERLPLWFGQYDCGTFACFAGWYLRDAGIHYPSLNDTVMNWSLEHFDLSRKDGDQLFTEAYELHNGPRREDKTLWPGPEAYAELERRMDYLADLIRKAGGTVPTKHTGLPASVQKILDMELEQLREVIQ